MSFRARERVPYTQPHSLIQKVQNSLAELERTRQRWGCMESVASALSSSTSITPSLEAVLEAALEGTGMQIGSLGLRDGPRKPLEVDYRRETTDEFLDAARTELEQKHILWVIERGRPLLLTPPGIPRYLEELHTEHFQAGNFLIVPIAPGQERCGALAVGTLERQRRFGEDDLKFVSLLATLASGSLRSMRALEEVQQFLMATIRSLCAALDARDPYTRGHSERVAMYALAVVNELEGMRRQAFPDTFRDSVRLGAMLHDVGKIGISDSILHKPDKLTREEFEIMKSHTIKGAEIVRGVRDIPDIVHAIKYHHENFDGTGYPEGRQGEQIPFIARIIGIADAFDAMTSERPYRQGSEPEEAVRELHDKAGRQHDPEIAGALLRAFEAGALSKQLDDDRNSEYSPEMEALDQLFGHGVKDLPSMPQVVHHVIERTRDPNCSVRELAEVVSRDQGLVSRILRLVNSAFYGFSRRISTISLALTILGMRNVRNLVINVGLAGFFRGGSPESRETRVRLWEHSVETAVGAMTLARIRGMGEPDEAFTAGLLHDIGRITLDYYHHDLTSRIETLCDEEGLSPLEAEVRVAGVDHGTIGAWVASQWNLPGQLCDAIRFHHDPARCALESPDSLQLTYLVGAAEALSELQHRVDDGAGHELWFATVKHLALTPEEVKATLEAMEREKESMMQVLAREA